MRSWFIALSPVSWLHIGFALLALLTGSYILWAPKGTTRHRQVGYLYVGSMLVVLTTAFGIYHLFGHFGIVHWGAVACWLALSGGMAAVWLRTYLRDWLRWHYFGLSASVAGLYTTFIVEATYRLFPAAYFWWTTMGTATLVLTLAGGLIYLNRAVQPAASDSGTGR
ncbi:hypothetical protein FAES_4239 [Fibrella aestuarina BUZ 2]|uniref:DUF2306 domain-containing protein n=1 Tax=Fibrella aestuarina BUZ 2 TaxID=1166018 RepID=I0KDN6_9BACT|nr:hypothetical protein [Fibrella aestuarina]CCH02239.1 hypothetical protein FAES_4239 [Fibrella aestuarina BUZ 2]